jgi:hypothetical protein
MSTPIPPLPESPKRIDPMPASTDSDVASHHVTAAGPWTLRDIFYSRRDVTIYTTEDPDWLVKVHHDMDRAHEELQVLLEIQSKKIPHRIEMHGEHERSFGTGPGFTWYAMRRYGGTLQVDGYSRTRWRTVAVNVLTFLQYFHTKCRKVHMDIKCPNIFCDAVRGRFVVGDYDLAGPIRTDKVARAYGDDMFWYYVAMGADPTEPLYSWRMDLTAVGYMLAAITWNREENNDWVFYREALRRREGKGTMTTVSDDELVAMREREMERIHPTVRAYLNYVGALPWSAAEPPSRDFYDQLIRFFM